MGGKRKRSEKSGSTVSKDIQPPQTNQEENDSELKALVDELPVDISNDSSSATKLRKKNSDKDVSDAKNSIMEDDPNEPDPIDPLPDDLEEDGSTEAERSNNAIAKRCAAKQQQLMEPKVCLTDKEAEQAIAEYMEKQNRPYSVQNIIDNFGGRTKKTQTQRIMDELAASQILTCKEYGKQKVYLVNQELFNDTTNDELRILDDQIKVRKDEYDILQNELKTLQAKLKECGQGMANSEYEAQIDDAKEQVDKMKAIIEPFKTGGRKLVTEAEIKKVDAALLKLRQEWKRRKRGCLEVVDQISESVEMNRKDFIKKVGLETDEENKVVNPI